MKNKNITHSDSVMDEVPSTSSQIVEQIEFIQEVDKPWVSKLNDSALGKRQNTIFSKKDSRKRKMVLILSIMFATYQLMDPVIE